MSRLQKKTSIITWQLVLRHQEEKSRPKDRKAILATAPCKAWGAMRLIVRDGIKTSIPERFQKDLKYKESQLVHGWNETWCKYLDYIRKSWYFQQRVTRTARPLREDVTIQKCI